MIRHTSLRVVVAVLTFVFIVTMIHANTAAAQEHTSRPSAAVDISRDPADVPPPIGNRAPATVLVDLTAREITGELDPTTGATYHYWTFNGKVPGPMIRVRQGDRVQVTLHNDAASHMVHSIDFHAALGPGGGAALSQVMPGEKKTFTFEATTPGLFVYHCGTPMIGDHIANGMYGLILVEPPGGMDRVDHEYYVMQGEIYTVAANGKPGLQSFSEAKLLQESPEYFVFNGAVGALTKDHPLHANTGDTIRIFFGNAGPNATSSIHVVGEIFTRDYPLGSLTSPPQTGIQTSSVPAGGAAILELKATTSGQFNFMDHAMARMAKGLMGTILVAGAENASLMHTGPADPSTQAAAVPGITAADMVMPSSASISPDTESVDAAHAASAGMSMNMDMSKPRTTKHIAARSTAGPSNFLDGCLTLQPDGKAMLSEFSSHKVYRLEGRALLFDANNDHIIHVTGFWGSMMESEDPRIPSFIVNTVLPLAQSCSAKLTAAGIRKIEARAQAAEQPVGLEVPMSDMAFLRPTMVITAGQEVVWRNSSATIHNVVADPALALIAADVSVPAGAKTFASAYLKPGDTFKHKFTVPGVYKYVCTLHEGNGMKGVVIVKPAPAATTLASASIQ